MLLRFFQLYSIFIIGLLAGFGSYSAVAQNIEANHERDFGLNPKLYNGVLYADFYGHQADGHPFIDQKEFHLGTLTLYNEHYEEVLLNYDIYSQKIILAFNDIHEASRQIEVPLENLVSFQWDDKRFMRADLPVHPAAIVQALGFDKHQFYFYWIKTLVANTHQNSKDYSFSSPKKVIYFKQGDRLVEIKKNKDLIRCMELSKQDAVKKWLRSNGVKVQKSNELSLILLTQFLNEL